MDQKTQTKVGVALIVVMLVAVFGGTMAYRMVWGAKIGEKCEGHNDCLWGGVCISRRCQKRCDADGDCPSGYGCASTSVTVTHSIAVFEDKQASSEKICFPMEKLQAQRAPKPAAPAFDPRADPAFKKIDVRTKVVVKPVTYAVSKPIHVDDAAFERAWNAIPESDRRTLAADALADRVLAAIAAAP